MLSPDVLVGGGNPLRGPSPGGAVPNRPVSDPCRDIALRCLPLSQVIKVRPVDSQSESTTSSPTICERRAGGTLSSSWGKSLKRTTAARLHKSYTIPVHSAPGSHPVCTFQILFLLLHHRLAHPATIYRMAQVAATRIDQMQDPELSISGSRLSFYIPGPPK